MFRKCFVVFISLGFLLVQITGCSDPVAVSINTGTVESTAYSSAEKEEDIPASESIQKLTEEVINDRYADAQNISFEDYSCIDEISYLAFYFIYNQSPYYGFTVAKQEGDQLKLSYFQDYQLIQEEAVTITQFGGTYPGTEDRVFHVTAGYVNDELIEEVILYYPGSIIRVIKLGEEQHGFIDIDINSDDSLLKIECKSSNGQIVYQKDFK